MPRLFTRALALCARVFQHSLKQVGAGGVSKQTAGGEAGKPLGFPAPNRREAGNDSAFSGREGQT